MLKHDAQPEDLLADESFLSWYFKTDPDHIEKWEQWIIEHPGRRELVQQAVELMKSFRITEKELPASQTGAAEQRLFEAIAKPESRPGRLLSLRRNRWWMTAAAVLLVIAGYLFIKPVLSARPELATAYGEIKKQNLPDGTEVMLNANSKLRYAFADADGRDREVWVKGEAFFHVRKTPMKSRFIVHTDSFDVIVTGTQFNVVNRTGKSNVMLQEGSVILHTCNGSEVRMIPGDFVEFNSNQLEKRAVKNDSVLAWKDRKLDLEETPMLEIAKIIKEHYGIDVILADDSVAGKTVSGMMPNDNLELLLQTLEATADFQIIRQGGKIIIRNQP